VIVPKVPEEVVVRKLRNQVGPILKELCRQKGVEVLEGNDAGRAMCLSLPPKSHRVCDRFLKGKKRG